MIDPVSLVLVTLADITGDVSLISSLAVIIGAIFVAVQLTQNNRMLRQNNLVADMDIVMRLYEFANSLEFQSAWLTVLTARISSIEDYEKLPLATQVSFLQVAALFESLGVLVEKKIMSLETVDDMFLTELAWSATKPFITGVRQKYGVEYSYVYFEKIYNQLTVKPSS